MLNQRRQEKMLHKGISHVCYHRHAFSRRFQHATVDSPAWRRLGGAAIACLMISMVRAPRTRS